MTDSEFVAQLRISQEFWSDKALACPEEVLTEVSGELRDRTGWVK
jgi:hypothetical protein